MARIAAVSGDGARAFALVKQMSAAGIAGRLRSYGPTLAAFAKDGRLEEAFEVDEHMAAAGVAPLEAELAALLSVSVQRGRADKVYALLHRLRVTVKLVR
jgi:proteinaceous RNase P